MFADADITKALKQFFGFDTFKGNQRQIIRSLLEGNDTFVLMPTGGGKSLCYQLPALMMPGTAIVVSPLIALMKNQVDALRMHLDDASVAHFLNSSLTKSISDQVKEDVRNGKTRLLYLAPETLTKEENIDFLKNVPISFYAIDEAHCISEWGHDFRPEYRRIRPLINAIGKRPVIALTATATPKVRHDIQKNLGMANGCVFKASFNRPNLYYEIRPKTANINRDIIKYVKSRPGKSGIIYCMSRRKVEELANLLVINEISALPYHAGMDTSTRTANQDAFIMEDADVIVATIAFGMGIDKPDVRYVIHYDLPKSLEGYYQETGRAGRDGGEGVCITFYSPKDLRKIEKFLQAKPLPEQEIGRQLLAEAAAYAESAECRRRTLLHYFGEEMDATGCGNCDNCRHPKTRTNATGLLLHLLETLVALGARNNIDYIVDAMLKKISEDDRISIFGEKNMAYPDHKLIHTLMRQAGLDGYIRRDTDNLREIEITPKGRRFLQSGHRFEIVLDNDFNDQTYEEDVVSGALDPVLFEILRDLRLKTARRLGLPPYVIFQDPSLEAMATMYPVTIEELQNIQGVGVGKATKFGHDFVKAIERYVVENDIVRPEDFRVRSVAQNSLKINIIQAIDRKIDLDELACSKGLTMSALLSEIETIVEAGTKLNIKYYIDKILDPELQQDLLEYFKANDEDDILSAPKYLDEEFSDDELRLARIMFISDLAN